MDWTLPLLHTGIFIALYVPFLYYHVRWLQFMTVFLDFVWSVSMLEHVLNTHICMQLLLQPNIFIICHLNLQRKFSSIPKQPCSPLSIPERWILCVPPQRQIFHWNKKNMLGRDCEPPIWHIPFIGKENSRYYCWGGRSRAIWYSRLTSPHSRCGRNTQYFTWGITSRQLLLYAL